MAAKRKEPPSKSPSSIKKPRVEVPEYHLSPCVKDENGEAIWPAPKAQMHLARQLIKECAAAGKRTLIVPDKDADGLSSGVILYRTLELLGLSSDLITVHLLKKGTTVHSDSEKLSMASQSPGYIFVLDQGSRKSGPLIDSPHKALIIDHHYATPSDFPADAAFVTACNSPPVATSALLTYTLCQPLHPDVESRCDWLCIVGTHGDLGTTLKWGSPFPDMKDTLKRYTKSALNSVVSLVNAPRRAASYDVASAWTALHSAEHPSDVGKNRGLANARQEVNAELERCTHAAPKFSGDGKVAVFRIKSEAQVHPLIATRWAGHLQSKALEIVMVANEGYMPGQVRFSCRVARCAKNRDTPVDIIHSLKEYASLKPEEDDLGKAPGSDEDQKSLLERLGEDFARGHVQASGGVVKPDEFEELMLLMKVGQRPNKAAESASPKKTKKATGSGQANTLMKYFATSEKAKAPA